MTLRDTDEAHVALLAAGAIAVGVGIVVVTLPAGLGLGVVAIVAGLVTVLATARSAVTGWRRPPVRTGSRLRGTDRHFWDPRTRLESLMGVSGGMGGGALLVSVLSPEHERWTTAMLSAAVFVPAATAWALVRRRAARRRE